MPEGNRPNPPNGSLRWTITGTYAGARWLNGFWMRNPALQVPAIDALTAWGQQTADLYGTHFGNVLANSVSYTRWDALYYGPTGPEVGTGAQIGGVGLADGNELPANVACVVSWKVQAHYKGGHPRTYLCGQLGENIADARLWKSTWTTNVAQRANFFLQAVRNNDGGGLEDFRLGVVSFVNKNQWRTPPVFRDFVEDAAVCDPRIDSMRRRLGPDL